MAATATTIIIIVADVDIVNEKEKEDQEIYNDLISLTAYPDSLLLLFSI